MKTGTKTQEREKKIGLRPVLTWRRVSARTVLMSNVKTFVINGQRTKSNSLMVQKRSTRMCDLKEKSLYHLIITQAKGIFPANLT